MGRSTKVIGIIVFVVLLITSSAQSIDSFELRLLSETSTTITLGWTPQPGFGYLFSAGGVLVSRTSDPSRSSVRFTKVASGNYEVAVIVKGATGTYPPITPPPPPTTATVTQTIVDGSTIPNIVNWQAVYDANGDGIEDDPGQIQFYIDGVLVLTESNPPFGDTFLTGSPSTADGQHTFLVKAISDTGTVLATNSVTATVATAPPPPPPPPSSGYPDASNTGVPAGTTLTPFSGDLIIATPGSTVSGMDVSGVIRIQAPGVTVENSKSAGVRVEGAANNPANPRATIQYVEINCGGPGTKGIQATFGDNGNNFNAYHVNIHNCEDGLSVENDFTITDSYIHDLAECGTCHNDGMQIYGGSRIIIQHNRIYGTDTSAIQFCNNLTNCAPMSDTLVQNNLLAGGGWTLYCPKVTTSNFRIINNAFSTIFYPKVGLYGPDTDCEGEMASGNFYYETSAPLPIP